MSTSFLTPTSWADALAERAVPGTVPIAGGTDLMVAMNAGGRPAARLLDLGRVPELRAWDRSGDLGRLGAGSGDLVRIGAGVPYRRVVEELAGLAPGLAAASRTVGSPQIRNRGTIG